MGVYKIPAFEGAEGLLQEISMARGKLLPGGLPNIEAAARIVLQVSPPGPSKYTLSCRFSLLSEGSSWCHITNPTRFNGMCHTKCPIYIAVT